MKFLDSTGLGVLWNKIKANFYTKTELSNAVVHNQAATISGDLSAYLYKESGLNFSIRKTSNGFLNISNMICGYVEAIKGQTIAWNQLAKEINSTNYQNSGNCTINNGIITIVGKEVVGYWEPFRMYNNGKLIPQSHKIYMSVECTNYNITQGAATYVRLFTGTAANRVATYLTITGIGRFSSITTCAEDRTLTYFGYANAEQAATVISPDTFSIKDIQLIDLTLIYGAGNEPSTPEQFEADYQKWFGKPLTYEPYDAGSLRNVMLSGLKTTGFNQWDEDWEAGEYSIVSGNKQNDGIGVRAKNKIRVLPDTMYYFQCNSRNSDNIGICWYDLSGNFISGVATASSSFTSPANAAYLTFFVPNRWYGSVYKNDICVNISTPNKNGTYEEYWESNASVPVTTMTGKLNGEGESVVIFPDGMKGVNDVHDEIYYVGGKTYAVKKRYKESLENVSWTEPLNGTSYFTTAYPMKLVTAAYKPNIISSKYPVVRWNDAANLNNVLYAHPTVSRIYFKSDSITTLNDVLSAMQGVMADYELATPLVYEVDDFTLPARYKCNTSGTEELLFSNDSEQISIIPSIDITYKLN